MSWEGGGQAVRSAPGNAKCIGLLLRRDMAASACLKSDSSYMSNLYQLYVETLVMHTVIHAFCLLIGRFFSVADMATSHGLWHEASPPPNPAGAPKRPLQYSGDPQTAAVPPVTPWYRTWQCHRHENRICNGRFSIRFFSRESIYVWTQEMVKGPKTGEEHRAVQLSK